MKQTIIKMNRNELLIIIAFASLVSCNEIDDIELQKRDAGKATRLNTISSSSPNKDYYIYQNSNPQSNAPNYSYQHSFYPSQTSSQYYAGNPPDSTATHHQSQTNQLNPHTSQFVPINFVPNPGYQSKYQLVQPKSSGNVQYALIQPPNGVPYPQLPHSLFSSNPASPVQQAFSLPHFNVAPNYQILGGPYLGHPTSMTLLPNPSAYSNLLYQNSLQGFSNNYPSNTQPKYGVTYAASGQQDYEKLPGPITGTKEENEIGTQNTDYTAPSDINSNYKNAYSSRNSYTKTK